MAKTKRRKIHEALYYIMLLIVVIFISGILFLISPVLFFGNLFYLYLVLIIIGISLGYFLKDFVHELDELTHVHHTSLVLIILLSALINFISITTSFSLLTEKTLSLSLLSATVFTISFLIPYTLHYYNKRR